MYLRNTLRRVHKPVQDFPGFAFLVVLFIFSADGTSGFGSEVNPDVLQLLRSEAVPAWQVLDEFQSKTSFSGSMEANVSFVGADKEIQELNHGYSYRVRRLLDRHCCLISRIKSGGRQSVQVINPEYGFEIDADDQSDDWVLSRAGISPERPVIERYDYGWDRHAWQVNWDASLVLIVTRDDLFRIDEAVRVSSDPAETRYRIKASNLEPLKSEHPFWEFHGPPGAAYSVIVDSAKDWCLISFRQEIPRDQHGMRWTIEGEITYQDRANGPVFPKRIVLKLDNDETEFAPDETMLIQLDAPRIDSGQMSEFYLPHYGIDDSAIRGDTRGRLWRFGYFLAGVVALLIAWRILISRVQPASD